MVTDDVYPNPFSGESCQPDDYSDAIEMQFVSKKDGGKLQFFASVDEEGHVAYLAKGKAKLIARKAIRPFEGEDLSASTGVFVTHLKPSTEDEVAREFEMKRNMQSELSPEASDYVDIEFEDVSMDASDQIGEEALQHVQDVGVTIKGQKVYHVPEAQGDLERIIADGEISFVQRKQMGRDVLQGMSYLHEKSYLHRDLKPENFLVVPQIGDDGKKKIQIKVTDFGKTKKVEDINQELNHSGNTRFAPPEGKSSAKGEVYSVGLILIRIFEEEFLEDDCDMLKQVEEASNDEASEGVRGLEKYLVMKSDTNACDTNAHPMKKLKTRFKQTFALGSTAHAKAVLDYKNELIKKLSKERPQFAAGLDTLLTSMLADDPNSRPTMAEALSRYQGIMGQD